MRAANDPHYIEFIARLRTVRKTKDYTQADLAQQLNKPQSYVSKVETCERRIDAIESARWCVALGVSLEDVLPVDLKPPSPRSTRKQRGKTAR
jgi:transcriptional regulator with XRE-family HTH domain